MFFFSDVVINWVYIFGNLIPKQLEVESKEFVNNRLLQI